MFTKTAELESSFYVRSPRDPILPLFCLRTSHCLAGWNFPESHNLFFFSSSSTPQFIGFAVVNQRDHGESPQPPPQSQSVALRRQQLPPPASVSGKVTTSTIATSASATTAASTTITTLFSFSAAVNRTATASQCQFDASWRRKRLLW